MTDVQKAEHLLQDMAWLKGLATRLANDRDDADDLVQEALIAAWRRQPDPTRPMRGWLTKVVRDLAGMKRRSERRRAARHALTDDAPSTAAPDELVAQMRLHRQLVDLVLELDEPYRSTIIARFVEGRTSASIAQSLGIPDGTVRKRVHEALSRLRAGLDASAGDRKQWAPAVIAFAQGGMYVAKPTKLVLVILAALLLAIATTIVILVPMRGGSSTAPMHAPDVTASRGASAAIPSVTAVATDAQTSPTSAPQPRAAARAAMLAAIARAREARVQRTVAPAASTPTPTPAAKLDIADKTGDTSEWSKRALGTLNEVLGECFDLAHAEVPDLTGTMLVRFSLVGEPTVGGLLERVEIIEESTTITQPSLRECFTQQLYALELDPPPDGVRMERDLTLHFPLQSGPPVEPAER